MSFSSRLIVAIKSAQGSILPVRKSGRTRNAKLVTRCHTHKKHRGGHLNLSSRPFLLQTQRLKVQVSTISEPIVKSGKKKVVRVTLHCLLLHCMS